MRSIFFDKRSLDWHIISFYLKRINVKVLILVLKAQLQIMHFLVPFLLLVATNFQLVFTQDQTEALAECSKLLEQHGFNLSQFNSTTGTGFTHDHCALDCVGNGKLLTHSVLNEGQACRDGVGICHNGVCEGRTNVEPSTLPPATHAPPTTSPTITHSPAYYKDPHNLVSMNSTIRYATFTYARSHPRAIVCLVPRVDSTVADCRQPICQTGAVPESTSIEPKWNYQCSLIRVTSPDDWILMRVEDENGKLIGQKTVNFQFMLEYHSYDSARGVVVDDGYGYVLFDAPNTIGHFYMTTEFRFKS